MKKIILPFIIGAILITFSTKKAKAQEEVEISPLSVNCDIVNNFVWRGIMSSQTVNIQPAISYTTHDLLAGLWGTTDYLAKYKELDLFVSFSISGFTSTLTDYFWTNTKKYFDYKNSTTGHNIEIGLSYKNKNLPLTAYMGTMLYGEDKKYIYDSKETNLNKNNYSTYFELTYNLAVKGINLDIFMGGTPFTGFYGNDFAITNIGIKTTKEIKLSDKFSLPMFASFAFNPPIETFSLYSDLISNPLLLI